MRQVVAVVGQSPGALTQLLWHLAAREALRIDGVEIWLRRQDLGAVGLGGLFQEGGWFFERLYAVLGAAGALLPRWELVPRVNPPPDHPPGERFVIFSPPDGRFRPELGARVAFLRASGAALVGALAGADPPRSTALVQAFELYARQSARLLSVSIDPRIAVTTDVRTFVCPDGPIAFVPPEDQVVVESVDFLAHADLVERDPLRRARAVLDLARTHLRETGVRDTETPLPTLRTGGRWSHLGLGDHTLRLGAATVALYAALLAAAPNPVRRSELAALARRGRQPASVDRMLNALRLQLEAVVATDPRWVALLPTRLPSGSWAVSSTAGRGLSSAQRDCAPLGR